ncbi:amidohydrolase family protein [Microlunatus ginsengisoli]|uniref:Amidohydrolase family protein n=1 Tax=Microlunatus ginsengisoli TaxID=363863 RepID=A0ABP6ZU47_9ACTN
MELIDHHCHPVVLAALERPEFEGLLNEAAGPAAGTSLFDSMLGLAIRRWCAPVLGLAPNADPDEYLHRRRDLGPEASRRLLAEAGLTHLLVDTGIADPRLCDLDQLSGLAGARTYEVLRLETLVESLLAAGTDVVDLPGQVERTLRDTTAVAAKSIAAYRVGLDLPDRKPAEPALVAALSRCRAAGRTRRLADPVVSGWLAWTALEAGLPLQLHTGLGDADLDLHRADPLLLTPFLRATEALGPAVLLLHSYPFQRSAGYLSQVYGHVFCDVGLAVHNTGAFSATVIRELLEVAPFGKVLFSTDAYGLAELFLVGSFLFRRGLALVLGELTAAGELDPADAERITGMITSENARRVYRL